MVRPVARLAATTAVLGAAGWYVAELTSWRDVAATLHDVPRGTLVGVVALALANVVTYWLVLMATLPGLALREAAAIHLPATAIANTVPIGGAWGTGFAVTVQRRLGHSLAAIAAAAVVSGIWNNLAKLVVLLVAAAAIALTGEVAPVDLLIALGGGAVLAGTVAVLVRALGSPRGAAVVARRAEAVANRISRPFGRPVSGWSAGAVELQGRAHQLVHDRWAAITATTLLSHGTLFVMLSASLRAVGLDAGEVSTVELLGVFAAARAATLVPMTPGGLGLVELSLTASLAATGSDTDRVVAGVILYRAATYAAPTLVGAVLLPFVWRRTGRQAAAPVDVSVPLVVDLDGSLLRVTTRTAMLARLGWSRPRELRTYAALHRRDRWASKQYLASVADIDVGRIPIRRPLLRWLEQEAAAGRRLYVASGAPDVLVRALVEHLGIFEAGWGSTTDRHLVGEVKAALLVEELGEAGFDYVGDAWEDLHVWRRARRAVLCQPTRRLRREVARIVPVERRFGSGIAALAATAGLTLLAAVRMRRAASPVPVALPGEEREAAPVG